MKVFRNNIIMVSYIFKFVPLYVLSSIMMIIASSISSYMHIYFAELISGAVLSENPQFASVLTIIGVYLGIYLFLTMVDVAHFNWLRPRFRLDCVRKMQKLMYQKSQDLPIEYFDDPEKYDQFSRAIKDADIRAVNSFDSFVELMRTIATGVTLMIYIVFKLPVLFVVCVAFVVFSYFIYIRYNRLNYATRKELETRSRYNYYISRTFYLEKNITDLKTTKLPALLISRNDEVFEEIHQKWKKTERKLYLLSISEELVYQVFLTGFTYSYLIYQLYANSPLVTLQTFSPVAQAVRQFINTSYRLSRTMNQLNDNSPYIDDFLWLMNFKPSEKLIDNVVDLSIHPAIKIDNLSFKYPNQEKMTLDKINLEVKPNEKIAIIGYNGAGKTTLTKLLLEFYQPDTGQLLLDGHSYGELTSEQIRKTFAITLQKFQIYATTVLENVLMREKRSDEDEELVWNLLDKVGLKEKFAKTTLGLMTILTKEFTNEGMELSGGEKQRIAIARALASNAPVIIFDEPTSSLDPIAETEINRLILAESSHRTVIIISHRLSTIVDVDKIYLMKDGSIIEQGTHDELMKLHQEYYTMFETQGKYYKNEERKLA